MGLRRAGSRAARRTGLQLRPLAPQRSAAHRREAGPDLALLLEISREITATLDLDRVLRSVVNLASKALQLRPWRGRPLRERPLRDPGGGRQEKVDPKDPGFRTSIARAAWAAGRGEQLYLTDRTAPGSDAERMFITIFGADLEADGVESGLYLPLKDEEGILGVLLFEASKPDFATPIQLEVAAILANQTAVALRNAQLYHQVPMVDALGALAARRQALWPRSPPQGSALRRLAISPSPRSRSFGGRSGCRATMPPSARPSFAPVRALVPGVVERIPVDGGHGGGAGYPRRLLSAPTRFGPIAKRRRRKLHRPTGWRRSPPVGATRRKNGCTACGQSRCAGSWPSWRRSWAIPSSVRR